MGTPDFAVPSLEMLVKEKYDVTAVITQKDKPKGRGYKVCAPPVKVFAIDNGIRVLQPDKVNDRVFIQELTQYNAELFITVAYGKILSKEFLDIPNRGCINVHASLLPKYRGASPIHSAIINGDTKTGITTMLTDVGMDTGDILLKEEVPISENATAGELHDILSKTGAKVLKRTLEEIESGRLKRKRQNDAEASYAPRIKKESGLIDWNKSAKQIHDLVRGTNPWPGAYTFYEGNRMRIWKTRKIKGDNTGQKPGTIIDLSQKEMIVSSGSSSIAILEIQFDSCKKMSVGDYNCGHCINRGEVLGK
mgnify:CR=1 FL=1